MGVGSPIIRVPRRGRRIYSGEFAVAAGAITGGSVKFRSEVAVTRTGAGVYRFQCLENGIAARPGGPCRLSRITPTINRPAGATDGGWLWHLSNDQMNASGFFEVTFAQQSFAAADPVQTLKVEFEIEQDSV